MKNNFCLILFFLIISCSPKINIEQDISNLKNSGTVFKRSDEVEIKQFQIKDVTKVQLYPFNQNIQNWLYPYFNSQNTIPNTNINLKYSIDKYKDYNFYFDKKSFKKNILFNDNKFIFVDDNSNIYVLDKSFKILHKYRIYKKKYFDKYKIKFSSIIEDNILYTSDNLGGILAFDLNNLKLLWKNDLGVPFYSNLVVLGNSLFSSNLNGKLFSFNLKTGKQNWSFETATDIIKSFDSYKIISIDNFLIFTNDVGDIFCLDSNQNSIIWNYKIPLSSSKESINLIKISSIIAEKKNLYISTNQNYFAKLDIATGNLLWFSNFSSNNTPVLGLREIITIDNDGNFLILNKGTGKTLFKKNLKNYFKNNKISLNNVNNFFLANNKIYFSNSDGIFFVIDANNLEDVNYKKVSSKILSNIISLNDEIVFVGENSIYKIK